MHEIKKIVIIGPESTGKSTLCKLLAAHYKTYWCPEYARTFLEQNGTNYTYNDLLTIARGQIEQQHHYEQLLETVLQQQPQHSNLLFIDTDMLVMKVWCEFVFGECHQYILDQIERNTYQLYLLCNVDLPWVKDEMREYPDLETRAKLFHTYEAMLKQQNVPYITVSGNYAERVKGAIKAIDTMFNPA